MIGRGGWRWYWEHLTCASCEHFRERNGRLFEPRGVEWEEEPCPACGAPVLICADCIARIEAEHQAYWREVVTRCFP